MTSKNKETRGAKGYDDLQILLFVKAGIRLSGYSVNKFCKTYKLGRVVRAEDDYGRTIWTIKYQTGETLRSRYHVASSRHDQFFWENSENARPNDRYCGVANFERLIQEQMARMRPSFPDRI